MQKLRLQSESGFTLIHNFRLIGNGAMKLRSNRILGMRRLPKRRTLPALNRQYIRAVPSAAGRPPGIIKP